MRWAGSRLCRGDLIAKLDRPGIAAAVLTTLDPIIAGQIEKRAAAEAVTSADFVAGAVRDFVERADDDLWFQLITVMRKAEDPGIAAIHAILQWVASEKGAKRGDGAQYAAYSDQFVDFCEPWRMPFHWQRERRRKTRSSGPDRAQTISAIR